MRRYRILDTIVLGTDDGEVLYDAGFFLECDGHTIWAVNSEGQREESTTIAAAIPIWLGKEYIVEVGWCDE
jgi:hypothetical protein